MLEQPDVRLRWVVPKSYQMRQLRETYSFLWRRWRARIWLILGVGFGGLVCLWLFMLPSILPEDRLVVLGMTLGAGVVGFLWVFVLAALGLIKTVISGQKVVITPQSVTSTTDVYGGWVTRRVMGFVTRGMGFALVSPFLLCVRWGAVEHCRVSRWARDPRVGILEVFPRELEKCPPVRLGFALAEVDVSLLADVVRCAAPVALDLADEQPRPA